MKKAIIFLICMGTMIYSIAQENPSETPKPLLTKEEYLQKSKANRTGAIVLISAGGAITLAGFAVALNSLEEDLGNISLFGSPTKTTNNDATFEAILIIGGVAAMLGSIGLFVSAHKYKRKALSVSFKNELAPQLQRSTVKYNAVPSLSLKIRL